MAPSNPVSADPEAAPPNLNVDHPRPSSYISSRMTDIESEDGDLRPHSPLPRSVATPQSRRGPAAGTTLSPNPPPSSGSRMSRTHVPSLAAHGFFRPMSSQRLQAQRSARPATGATQALSNEDGENEIAGQQRRSIVSNSTILPAMNPPDSELPPPSRGTEFTDPVLPDRGTSTASPTGNTTIRSMGDSVGLLHDKAQGTAPSHLNLNQNYMSDGSQEPQRSSPLSFRSGFLKSNKMEGAGDRRRDSRGHERLSSSPASTPGSGPTKPVESEPKNNLGKNYEYFLGNTIFFAGGRLQNSRDRPVNILTGILIVLPATLFFGYSYVYSFP